MTGGPTDYVVTVDTPAGAGNVQVQLVDDDTIVDADLAPIGGTGSGAVVARSESVYADSVAPSALAIAAPDNALAGSTSVDFFVTFDEAVSGVDVADFATADTGLVASTVTSVTATADDAVFRISVSLSGGAGTVSVNLVDNDSIVDAAGNALGGVGTSGAEDGSLSGSLHVVSDTSINGVVWVDSNQDSLRGPGELGRAGITVYVDLNNDGDLDGGEPSTTTLADDPGTPGIDETGWYSLTGVSDATDYTIAVDIVDDWVRTSPLSFSQDDGTLSFKDSITAGTQPDDSLRSVTSVVVSQDGRHAYTTAVNGHALTRFERDSVADTFVKMESIESSSTGFTGFSGPRTLVLTPDQRYGYVGTSNSIFVVQRDLDTGSLSFVARYENGVGGIDGLVSVYSVAVSPDGQTLYAVGLNSQTLSIFDLDPATGLLQLRQQIQQGADGVIHLDDPLEVDVTPDGRQVFVTDYYGGRLTVYDVIPGSGKLVESQSFTGNSYVYDTAISPDGTSVYVAQRFTGNVKPYTRDLATGVWTAGVNTNYGVSRASAIDISPDGRFAYLVDDGGDRVVVLSRDEVTGALSVIETLNDVSPHDALNGAQQLAVTPDGQELLVVAYDDNSISRFGRVGGTVTPSDHSVTTTYRHTGGADFGLFNDIPQVVSLTTAAPASTGAATVDFNLSFSEPVTGVDLTDFSLATTTLVNPSISSVTGGPTDYVISVVTGTGSGPLQLQLNDNDSIVDGALDPIGGAADASASSPIISVDRLAPAVSSVAAQDAINTNAASVDYLVTFSEAVTGVDALDFTLEVTGVTNATVTSVTENSPSAYLVTVNTGDGNGTIRLDVVDNGSIADLAGNSLAGGFTAGSIYTVDKTVPTVASATIVGSPSATAASIQYTVAFSESVTGVTTDDFQLATSGVTGATITGLTGSGASYTVTVGTGSGAGTVRLDLADNDSIVDGAGNPLGGSGNGNGDFSGATHDVDLLGPQVTSIDRLLANPTTLQQVTFHVEFDEAVTGVDTGDFAVAVTGTMTGTVTDVVPHATLPGYVATVSVNDGEGTVRLDVPATATVLDTAGNALNTAFTSGEVYDVDRQAPTITSIARTAAQNTTSPNVDFNVTFSEEVTGVGVGDFQVVADGTISGGVITSVTGTESPYLVSVSVASGQGNVGLGLSASPYIIDLAGNNIASATSGATYSMDLEPPTVLAIRRLDAETTGENFFRYEVEFSERVSGVDVTDFSVVSTGGASATVAEVVGGGHLYHVTLSHGSGDGTVTLEVIDDDTIEDFAGLLLGDTGLGNGNFVGADAYILPPDTTYSGVLWDDLSGDGVKDAGEPPLVGVDVFQDLDRDGVLEAGEPSVVTAADGSYSIVGRWQENAVITRAALPLVTQTFPADSLPALQRIPLESSYPSYGNATQISVSSDGSVIAFEAWDEVAGKLDVFAYETGSGTVTKLSVGHDGSATDGSSRSAIVSADGQLVAFHSGASNLIVGDANDRDDIFVHNRTTGVTELISVADGGVQANRDSHLWLDMSADGRFVVFATTASNWSHDNDSFQDVFLRDRVLQTTEHISTGTYQIAFNSYTSGANYSPSISDDGNIIAYTTSASQIYPSNNPYQDLFIHNRSAGTTKQVLTFTGTGEPNGGDASFPVVSGDGSTVIFISDGSALVPGMINNPERIYAYDVATEKVEMISRALDGSDESVETSRPAISYDGRFVAYTSRSTELAASDRLGQFDGYVHDRDTGLTRVVSLADGGGIGPENVWSTQISDDASAVAFNSYSKLLPGDVDGHQDIYYRPLNPFEPPRSHVVTADNSYLAAGLDFGVAAERGGVSGTLWEDTNRDGIQDAGEPVIAGRDVFVDLDDDGTWDSGEPIQTSSPTGAFSFDDLAAGTYPIRQVLPANWSQTTGGSSATSVTIGAAQNSLVDFEDLAHTASTIKVPSYESNGFVFTSNAYGTDKWWVDGNPVAPDTTSIRPLSAYSRYVMRADGRPFSASSLDALRTTSSVSQTLMGIREGLPNVEQTLSLTATMSTYTLNGFDDIVALVWSHTTEVDNFNLSHAVLDQDNVLIGSMADPGQISGVVWEDIDRDGVIDPTETLRDRTQVFIDLNQDGRLAGRRTTSLYRTGGRLHVQCRRSRHVRTGHRNPSRLGSHFPRRSDHRDCRRWRERGAKHWHQSATLDDRRSPVGRHESRWPISGKRTGCRRRDRLFGRQRQSSF